MGTHVFFQRFVAGKVEALPFREVTSFLAGYGALVQTDFDVELKFLQQGVITQDGIDGYVTVIGDEVAGVSCMAIEQPAFDTSAEFCFALIERFDVALFDDALRMIFLKHQSSCVLPEAMVAACAGDVRRVASAFQVWQQSCVLPSKEASPRSGFLAFTSEHGVQRHQHIDAVDHEQKRLRYYIDLHPAACSAGTTRAMRHAMARIHRMCHQHPPSQLEIYFNYADTCTAVLEASKVGNVDWPTLTVSPPPVAFDGQGQLAPPAPFAADRNADATARLNAARCSDAATAELGLTLSPDGDSFSEFARFVAERRNRLSTVAGPTKLELLAETVWFAGSYWGELLRHLIGGQWGYVELSDGRHPVLETYSRKRIFPLLDIVDTVLGEADDWLAARLDTLRALRARSLDHADFVADIHPFCALLRGQVVGQFSTVPLHDYLPVAELDFSLNSLFALERWIRQFGAQRQQFDSAAAIGVMHTAGAYFGEVIRAQAPSEWRWENYHDYFDGTPGLPDLPYQPTTAAVLLGYGHLLFPIATIGECMTDPSAPSLLAWMGRQLKETVPDWTLPSPTRVASDDDEAYRLDVHPHNAVGFAEHLAEISESTEFRFDFSAESLGEVDRLITDVRAKQQGRLDVAAAEILYLLACYAGEVLVRGYAARWRYTRGTCYAGRSNAAVLLETQGGSLIDPISKAFDLARHTNVDPFAHLVLRVGDELALRQRYPVAAEIVARNGAEADLSLEGLNIAECVASLPVDERDYVNITAPPWLAFDPLAKVAEAVPTLLAHGQAVWAHVVQVNQDLFAEAGFNDSGLPGEVIYDPSGVYTPDQLAPVAKRLFKLRGKQDSLDPTSADLAQLLAVANHLDAETTRAFGMPVPLSLCPRPLRLSTLFFDREHLPGGRLHLPYLPILISDRCPGVAMVLPGRWWPQALLGEIDSRIDRAQVDVWQSAWRKLAAGRSEEDQQYFGYRTQALERYARVGTSPERLMQQLEYGLVPFRAGIDPPPFEWEWDLSTELSSYAECLLTEVEIDRARGQPINQTRACQAFVASALAQLINLHRLLLCGRRRVDNDPLRLDPDHIQYAALGFAAGMEEAALESARLYCLAWQFQDFYSGLIRPEVRAVFKLFAAHLEMAIPDLKPFRSTPQLDALVDTQRWRSNDDEEIRALLEAACAEHMRLAPTGPFQGLPAALLLIFKLRQLSGLSTPALTHPLFSSPLLLPDSGSDSAATGELLARVRERMRNNGFDEQRIRRAMESRSPLLVDSSKGALPVPDQPAQVVHLRIQRIDDESSRMEKARQQRPALFGFLLCAGLALVAILLMPTARDTLLPLLWMLLVALGWRAWKYLQALRG